MYVKNRFQLDSFMNEAIRKGEAVEQYEENGKLVQVMNKATGDLLRIEYCEMPTYEAFQANHEVYEPLLDAARKKILEYFDGVVIIGLKRITRPESKTSFGVINLTENIPVEFGERQLKELCHELTD